MADWSVWVIGWYALQAVALAVIIVISVLFWDKRYNKRKSGDRIPEGFVRTEEVSIDPGTNKKTRVYYHPGTGDRIYVSEE